MKPSILAIDPEAGWHHEYRDANKNTAPGADLVLEYEIDAALKHLEANRCQVIVLALNHNDTAAKVNHAYDLLIGACPEATIVFFAVHRPYDLTRLFRTPVALVFKPDFATLFRAVKGLISEPAAQ